MLSTIYEAPKEVAEAGNAYLSKHRPSFKERDIVAGDFTYGERIELVRILSNDDATDFEKTRDMIELLHDEKPTAEQLAMYAPYASRIAKGINEWLKREHQECYVEPTADQKDAGIEKYAQEVGEMGGIVYLAESRNWTFEQVLKLPYTEVFTIWKVEASRTRFDRRYSELLKRRSKKYDK